MSFKVSLYFFHLDDLLLKLLHLSSLIGNFSHQFELQLIFFSIGLGNILLLDFENLDYLLRNGTSLYSHFLCDLFVGFIGMVKD